MEKKGDRFKFTIRILKPFVKYKLASANYVKPKKGDVVPMSKALLLSKYKKIQNLPSPHISPCNSEANNESDNSVSDWETKEGLEFDSDESDSDDSIDGKDNEDDE